MNKFKTQKHYPTVYKSGSCYIFFIIIFLMLMGGTGCDNDSSDAPVKITNDSKPEEDKNDPPATPNYVLADIDLSNWKVTLPIGRPTEVEPPSILNYATNGALLPFMYNDSTDGSIVFHTYPGASTANSSYSRTELREQMVPGSNSTNWTFAQGGKLRGTLAVPEVSMDDNGKPHRIIIMQIHGRLTNAQRDRIGEDDNNAPPVLKIYWQDGKVRVKTKVLKDLNVSDTDILFTNAWTDDAGKNFSEVVNHEKFTLEVNVSDGRMEVTMNDSETFVYDDIHMEKWGVFENYFKAGNYLVTTDSGAFSKVKYYELEVSHD